MPRESKDGESLPFGMDQDPFEDGTGGPIGRTPRQALPQPLPMITGIDDPPLPFGTDRRDTDGGEDFEPPADVEPGAAPPGETGSADSAQVPASALVLILLLIAVFGYVAIRQLNRYESDADSKVAEAEAQKAVLAVAPAVSAPRQSAVAEGGSGESSGGHPSAGIETAPAPGPAAASEPQTAAVTAPSSSPAPARVPAPVALPPPAPAGSALDEARQGDYATAARIWQDEKSRMGGRFTLQLSVNCDSRYLGRFFDSSSAGSGIDELFLLPVTLNGQACYRVCSGDYPNESSARSGAQIRQRQAGAGTPLARVASLADLLKR
jgi:septal ring-binding cell division protein DamX